MSVKMKFGVLGACFLGSLVAHGAATRVWDFSKPAGDLMDPANWDTATVEPAKGDTLKIMDAESTGTQTVDGSFTLSKDTPVFNQVIFGRPRTAKNRALDLGDWKLNASQLAFRYSEIMRILSGSYFVGQLSVGDSTSRSDESVVTIDGADTFVRVSDQLKIGTGSSSVDQSRGHVTVSGGATVDAATVYLGIAGGWKNSLTVTGEGTRLVTTNGAQTAQIDVGMNRTAKPADKGGYFYSQYNTMTVSNHAALVVDYLSAGYLSSSDLTTTGNVLTVSDHATVRAGSLHILGSNTVNIASDARVTVTNGCYVGYWGYNTFDETVGAGARMTVSDGGLLRVDKRLIVGSNYKASRDNVLTVANGGVVDATELDVGMDSPYHEDCRLVIEEGGVVTNSTFYIASTNKAIVAGTLVITNIFYVGRNSARLAGVGSSQLIVTGGTVKVAGEVTTYIGNADRLSVDDSILVTDGGLLECAGSSYIQIGKSGRNCSMTVTGKGSRVVHNAVNSARNVMVGAPSTHADLKDVYQGNNRLVISDGGSFYTRASVNVYEAPDSTVLVDQGSLAVGNSMLIGTGAHTNGLLKIAGSAARVSVTNQLQVGANGRIVFDLSDAKSSSEALLWLKKAPSLAAGSRICITSSHPNAAEAEGFDVTLMSCAADMDLSNVSIEIDPASGLRRREAANPRVLRVTGGRRPGLAIIVR